VRFKICFLFIGLFLISAASWGAAVSASYKITTETIDAGGQIATSTSYRLIGKAQGRELTTPQNSAYKIGEGFCRSAYFGSAVILAPIVTSISPSSATSGDPISLTIFGANFTAGSTVVLSLSGQTSIVGTNVIVVSSSQITCDIARRLASGQ